MRTGKRYTKEFKESAIQLALNSDKSGLQVAEELGMSEKTLYAWLKQYRKEHNLESSTSSKPSLSKESLEEENRRLRRELARVTKEREILKKATAFFAKEAH